MCLGNLNGFVKNNDELEIIDMLPVEMVTGKTYELVNYLSFDFTSSRQYILIKKLLQKGVNFSVTKLVDSDFSRYIDFYLGYLAENEGPIKNLDLSRDCKALSQDRILQVLKRHSIENFKIFVNSPDKLKPILESLNVSGSFVVRNVIKKEIGVPTEDRKKVIQLMDDYAIAHPDVECKLLMNESPNGLLKPKKLIIDWCF